VTEVETKKVTELHFQLPHFKHLEVRACIERTILVRKHSECVKATFPKPGSEEPQRFM